MNVGGESCEIRILSRSIHKIYTMGKVKKQILLFLSSRKQIPKFSGQSHGLASLIYEKNIDLKITSHKWMPLVLSPFDSDCFESNGPEFPSTAPYCSTTNDQSDTHW